MPLSARQASILRAVVLEFQDTGRPVGSRALVESGAIVASPSTVRSELQLLEQLGYLTHPHTSAGRVPTDLGYRTYVDELLASGEQLVRRPSFGIDPVVRLDDALTATTEALAQATELLALVTAPPAAGATIHRVEVLQVQPGRIVVIAITTGGDVTRHEVTTDLPVDAGLVAWAGEYLNETVAGMALGQRMLRQRLTAPGLSMSERRILELLAPALTELVEERSEVLVGASPRLLDHLGRDVQQVVNLVHALEERRRLLDSLRSLSGGIGGRARRITVRIGDENDLPELRPLSVVAAPYGLATRQLGTVTLVGPRAMDYPLAMRAVSTAADSLSGLVEELWA